MLGADCWLRSCILTVCVYDGWLGWFLYISRAACLKIIVMCNVIIMLALRRAECAVLLLYK